MDSVGRPLVLDLGTGSAKAEYAGAETPQTFMNVVGHVKQRAAIPQQELEGIIDNSFFISNDVTKHRGLLRLSYPMMNGHVTDWGGVQHLLNYVNEALDGVPKDHPLLLTESALTSRPQRERLAQIVFEQLQHPSALFAVQALLSLYSTGNTTGVVLDVGDGVTHACPVYHGYSIRDAVRRIDFGGRDVTQHLQYLLRQQGTYLDSSSAEFEIVRQIKEQRCKVSLHPLRIDDLGSSSSSSSASDRVKHRLPDGVELWIGSSEQTLAPEVLFNPALMGRECPGVAQVVNESIRRADVDLRRHLFHNLFVTGGSTLFDGFANRFLNEMTKRTPRDCPVRVTAPSERMYTAWIGGSFLAQMSTFKSMAVQKSDYAEVGPNIIHSKLFC